MAPISRPLWLDAPDAAQKASVGDASSEARSVAMDLITKGFSVIHGAQDPALCQEAISDYGRYVQENEDYVSRNKTR